MLRSKSAPVSTGDDGWGVGEGEKVDVAVRVVRGSDIAVVDIMAADMVLAVLRKMVGVMAGEGTVTVEEEGLVVEDKEDVTVGVGTALEEEKGREDDMIVAVEESTPGVVGSMLVEGMVGEDMGMVAVLLVGGRTAEEVAIIGWITALA